MLLLSLLPSPQDSPEVVPVPFPGDSHAHSLFDVRAGFGAWSPGGFSARTPMGSREIEDDLLAEAQLELGIDWEGWGVSLGGSSAGANDVQFRLGWVRMSTPALLEGDIAFPFVLRLSAGLLLGSVDIAESGFGDFDPALGFLGRLTLETPRSNALALAIWVEARGLTFDYDEPTLDGDDDLGGVGFALGLSAGLRF